MGNLFGSSSPTPLPPPPPKAPVEEAEFKPGGDGSKRKDLKKLASGKKRLQIPLSGAKLDKAVQTGD